MSFENLISGMELDPQLLGENPAFRVIVFRDKNPLSGRVKRRHVEAPNKAMTLVHHQLTQFLRGLKVEMPYATAFRPGDSPLKNVARHRKSRFFYLLDLKNAYRQVDVGRLTEVLCALGAPFVEVQREVSAFLGRYCMSQFGGLPIGAPASPDLFNLYCAVLLDAPIGKVCERYGLTYTRYCDDLTISGIHTVSRAARRDILETIRQAGFQVNHQKTRLFDLAATHKGPCIITGVALELGGRVYVPRGFLSHLRGMLNLGLRGDLSLLPKISGSMSVFYGLTDRSSMNATEKNILRRYEQLQRLVRAEKRRAKAST